MLIFCKVLWKFSSRNYLWKMSRVRVTKEFTFDCAHALYGYNGLCRNIHGHTYKLFVTVIGEICKDKDSPFYGMLIDFSQLKNIVNQHIVNIFDHSLVLSKEHNISHKTIDFQDTNKLIEFDGQVSCENMVVYFAKIIRDKIPQNVELHSVRLYETPTSFAEWYASDN